MLGASLQEIQECVDDAEFEDRVQRFAAEGGGPLYVVKVKDEAEGACCIGLFHGISTQRVSL